MKTGFFKKTAAFFLLTMLIACAGMPVQKRMNISPLSERVNQFMQASVNGNWGVAYGYYDSAFRNSISKETFEIYPRKMKLKSYTVEEISIVESEKRAEVTVLETISIPQGFTFKGIKKKQIWVLENRQWVMTEAPADNPLHE